MPLIPIPAEQFPSRLEKMPDNVPYIGIIRSFTIADKLDKNNRPYASLSAQVVDPLEYKDRVVGLNYIRLLSDEDQANEYTLKAAMQAMAGSNGFGRLLSSAKMRGKVEAEDFLGKEIRFMIQNEEYPAGSDNWNARIKMFLD